jgi:type III pantothenate kinase
MTTLLVDIGNTRVKWALLRGARLGRMHAMAHGGTGVTLRKLVRAAPVDLRRIVAVNVAGASFERALTAAARARFAVTPEYIRSTREVCGVRNAYRDTWRLGADRWVSVIGAHHLLRGRPAVIVNVGTALTVDGVSMGRHLGGAIAPGPATMIASLLAGTHGIRRRANGGRARARGLFASDTASALEAGASFAAAAFVDRACREAAITMRARPMLLLTGGAATGLRPYIKSGFRMVPDLVLRGLAALASANTLG